jgi:hypothetical protein
VAVDTPPDCGVVSIISVELNVCLPGSLASRAAAMAKSMQAWREPVNSLLSSYEALPGGSNPQRKECEAAINYNTPFTVTSGDPGQA